MTQQLPSKNIVLYADDDPDDQQLVEQAFAAYSDHVTVVLAQDGLEALSYLNSLTSFDPNPCLIILDINMPRMDGKEALRKLRRLPRFADVPVVLFSTSSQDSDCDFARTHGAGFITKPLDVRQMDRIADTFVAHCADEIRRSLKKKG